MGFTKHIPNFFTCCNIAAGCVGIVMTFQGNLIWAAALIWTGAIFDFFDGFFARWLKQYSDIGKQLDSLADMVTFGVLPSSIVFVYLQANTESATLPYMAYLITIFSGLRLAKFNIDERQLRDIYRIANTRIGDFY